MIARTAARFLRSVDKRLLVKFAWNFGWKGVRSVRRFRARLRRGEYFPAFLFVSVTNRCNLGCQGCWVTPRQDLPDLDLPTLDRIVRESKAQGCRFFGILGGEPLLHAGLSDLFFRHPDGYFLLFTNGTLVTDDLAAAWRRAGNVSPLISIEGSETVSDERRGGHGVYSRTLRGLEICRRHRLILGVATSVCRSNLDDLVSEAFVNRLLEAGVHYLWYYVYRPVGPRPSPELALSAAEIVRLRRFMVDLRPRVPMLVVDSYWDHEGKALCPAAVGISHHINPEGRIEPCPPIQFSTDRLSDGATLAELFQRSGFLRAFREAACRETRGCILMERPEVLRRLVLETGALDSTGRGTGMAELEAMRCAPSHAAGGVEIPERYWPYRLAKKRWFFGFGAYG